MLNMPISVSVEGRGLSWPGEAELSPADPGGRGKRAVKRSWLWWPRSLNLERVPAEGRRLSWPGEAEFAPAHPDGRRKRAVKRSWNHLPSSLRQPHFSPSVSVLPVHAPTTSSQSVNSPLSPSITHSLFQSRLKTYLFHKSFPHRLPSSLRTDSTDFTTGPFLLSISVLCF